MRGKYEEISVLRLSRMVVGLGCGKGLVGSDIVVGRKFSFVVGIGRMMHFWKDKWCGVAPLSASFLICFCSFKECLG